MSIRENIAHIEQLKQEAARRSGRSGEEVLLVAVTRISTPALRACTIREAVMAECEEIAVSQAEGRICGAETVSCPPAVPIAVCGEIITQNMIQQFEEYNITKVSVLVKE